MKSEILDKLKVVKDKILNNLEKITDVTLIVAIISMLALFEGRSSILYILVILLFGIVTLINMIVNRKIFIDKKVIWMIAFTAFAGMSILWAGNKSGALSVLLILIANEAIAYFVMTLIHFKKERFRYVLNAIIVGTIILAIRTFIPNGFLVYYSSRGPAGLLNANYVGMYGAIAANIALYYFLEKKEKRYIASFILCVIIMILSFSRKAIIFLILPMVLYYIFKDLSIKKSLRRIGISVALLSIMFVALFKVDFLYDVMGNRIEAMLNGVFDNGKEVDASVSARMKMIEIGKELFADKPIIGYGLNNYKDMLAIKKPYGMTNVYAHNNYIELAVDVGIIGLAIYYSLYIFMLVYTVKNIKKLNKLQILMVAMLITLMVCEYGVVSYYGDFYHLLLSLVWMSLLNVGVCKDGE